MKKQRGRYVSFSPSEPGQAVSAESGFGTEMREHLVRAQHHNEAVLASVTARMLVTCRDGSLIHTGGSGHSLALVMETFYRAGGLACVNPLYHPGLLPLHGAAASTIIERADGFARILSEEAAPQDGDLAFVFSNSGTNPVPVQLALQMRKAGAEVVAVTSSQASEAAPTRAGQKLADIADYVLDTLVRPGDASYPATAPRTGALSSLICVYLWQLLLARLSDRAETEGIALPLWRSNNAPGGEEHNAKLAERYRSRIHLL